MMELQPFGNSNLHVTKIGLGLAALGRPGYINLGHSADLQSNYSIEAMQAHTHHMLDMAYQQGIRYFDAARSYGKAEAFLSTWHSSKYPQTCIGSKWGYTYTANWQIKAEKHEVKEHSIAVLNRQWQESFDLLEQNLSIYHIHSATLESGVLDNQAVLNRLWELKEQGVIIGLSTSGPQQSLVIEKALCIQRNQELLFGSVQATWNILERSTTDALKKAYDLGLGIIIKEAVANGRLTSRSTDQHLDVLKKCAATYQVGIDALAIAYIIKQDWVSTVLSGAANQAHLASNLNALSIHIGSSDTALLDSLSENSGKYWKTRSLMVWN